MKLGDEVNETGSNAGSNFSLERYNDAGAFLGYPLTINRATGNAQFNNEVRAAGAIFVSTTTDSNFYLNGDATQNILAFNSNCYLHYSRTNGNLSFFVNGVRQNLQTLSGAFQCDVGPCAGVGAYVNISDVRTKTNIEPATAGLEAVLALNPVKFKRIASGAREVGFVAQDVQAVLPDAVVVGGFGLPDDNGGGPALVVVSEVILAALVRSVQELEARLAAVEGK
jgi:hypothetical protein